MTQMLQNPFRHSVKSPSLGQRWKQQILSLFQRRNPHRRDPLWKDGSDMIAVHGRDGRFLRVSGQAEAIFGEASTSLIGRTLIEFVAPDHRGLALGFLTRAAGQGVAAQQTLRLVRQDCKPRWIEIAATPLEDGTIRTITRDVTKQRLLQEALAEAKDSAEAQVLARSKQLADLSHEIRTPLNAVIGFADMMQRETFGPVGSPKYAEYATLIHRSGEHLVSLVSDLLDLSKIEADRYQLNIEETDIAAIARDCAEMMRLTAEEAGLALSLSGDSDLCFANVDPRAIRQIILNLLSNAIKFTRKGGVSLSLQQDVDWVRVTVTDTGIGMKQEAIAKIGRRFEQAHREGVRGTRGSGLGLALVRSLAELHGGQMHVSSALEQGTRVTIELPIGEMKPVLGVKPASNIEANTETNRQVNNQAKLTAKELPIADKSVEDDQAFEELMRAVSKQTSRRVA